MGIFIAKLKTKDADAAWKQHQDSGIEILGKVEKDQVEDYANRRGISVEEAEKWLSPSLNY